jgi:Holliday junction resolvasome RuvABC DNA-binding subunit|nr:MAG TPA: hypothetical protein [Caudoviricetes sp.]
MNEEEKKAIEDMNRFANGIDMSCVSARQMQIVLNLIEKLSKENEQLRTEVNSLKKENEELNEKILDNAGIYQLGFKDGEESYIKKVKDKIRKNEEIIDISNDGDLIHELYQKNKVYEELLESEE